MVDFDYDDEEDEEELIIPALGPRLLQALKKIQRPGTFVAQGSVPTVLPGLEVAAIGAVGLPLSGQQARDLKKRCRQAPYGKGEKTIVDTKVRRVWQLGPDQFQLTNPAWELFVENAVASVQQELGLEKQKLESHLYQLLLYEPGSFFLPHRDGERLDRMVATLVVILPSSYQGGELIVRHEGHEQTIDFTTDPNHPYRTHYVAFYADCEHEVRPLREGHRLCLVYNLTLAKEKKPLQAPRLADHIEEIEKLLRDDSLRKEVRKLAVPLEHQYTQSGVSWSGLKGVDRSRARALAEAAQRADWKVYLTLLTLWESGSSEDGYEEYGRRGYSRPQPKHHTMGEIYDTSLTVEHWSEPDGHHPPIAKMAVGRGEIVPPEALTAVEPEEDFEGYTGNEGMTLERWYRHAAIVLWPNERHFDVLCDCGTGSAIAELEAMIARQARTSKAKASELRKSCLGFASQIITHWQLPQYPTREPSKDLLPALVLLKEPALIGAYLADVVPIDAAIDPTPTLPKLNDRAGFSCTLLEDCW